MIMVIEREDESDKAIALAAVSLAPEDFEEAAEALLALMRESRMLAGKVASEILKQRIGDIYYRAHAFDVLYAICPDVATEYIESFPYTESVYVLGTMIESVTEDAGVSNGRERILKAVSLLRKAIDARAQEERDSITVKIAQFQEAYGDLG